MNGNERLYYIYFMSVSSFRSYGRLYAAVRDRPNISTKHKRNGMETRNEIRDDANNNNNEKRRRIFESGRRNSKHWKCSLHTRAHTLTSIRQSFLSRSPIFDSIHHVFYSSSFSVLSFVQFYSVSFIGLLLQLACCCYSKCLSLSNDVWFSHMCLCVSVEAIVFESDMHTFRTHENEILLQRNILRGSRVSAIW